MLVLLVRKKSMYFNILYKQEIMKYKEIKL